MTAPGSRVIRYCSRRNDSYMPRGIDKPIDSSYLKTDLDYSDIGKR